MGLFGISVEKYVGYYPVSSKYDNKSQKQFLGGIRSARSAILRRKFDAKTGSRSKIYVHPLKSTNLGQNGQVNAHWKANR